MSWRNLPKAMFDLLGGFGRRVPRKVFEWVEARNIQAGSTESLDLPSSLSRASRDGKVYAARLSDGRLCVMVKTHIGYKDNFAGAVRCSGPFLKSEVRQDVERPFLSLVGHGIFEELYIRKQAGEQELEVFFDLN
ncbi:MAG: hypothetical protein QOG72_334 [Sphingomonadales bacterium]|jgi:hypothetical protein|nr:hypothetical protein [Sphingomonadales bacterium]